MAVVALVLLAIIWAAVLVPPLVRQRSEVRPADSIGDFRRRLGVLQRTTPGAVNSAYGYQANQYGMAPVRVRPQLHTSSASRRRRRDILIGLGATAIGTLFIGLLPAFRVMLWMHVLTDVLLAAYIALLVQMRKRAEERQMKVRSLTPVPMVSSSNVISSVSEEESVTVIAQHQ